MTTFTTNEEIEYLEKRIRLNFHDLIIAQDGLRGLSLNLVTSAENGQLEQMEFVIESMANLIQRVTNELDNNVGKLNSFMKGAKL